MSNYAFNIEPAPAARRARARRRPVGYRVNTAWRQVQPAQVGVLHPPAKQSRPGAFILLVLVAIAMHAGVIWYVRQAQPAVTKRAISREVAVELLRPPKPLPPKVAEPRPPPRKQPAKVLPQIQAATPDPPVVTPSVSAEPPLPVEAVAVAPSQPVELPVTAPIGHAGYLNNPPPEYPATAVRQNWEGTVVLRVRVLSTGQVDTIEISESSGRRVLDEQAMRTVKTWTFTPSKRGDTPVDGWATVPIEFRLDS